MSSTYDLAADSVIRMMESVKVDYHPYLIANEVRVDVIMAFGKKSKEGEILTPAVMAGGYPAYAKIRVTRLDERLKRPFDAIITLDGDQWYMLEEPTQKAILDHELTHLELVLDENGRVKHDDQSRPVLRLRKHDVQFGFFNEVARRHLGKSIECQTFLAVAGVEVYGNLLAPARQNHQGRVNLPVQPEAK
jgi:hypothetical protein